MGRPAVLKVDILSDAKGFSKGVDEADSKLGKLGSGAKKAGLLVGAGLAVGAVAVGAFAVKAVGAASSVEQSFGAVESVFGKAAAQVKGYADTAASQLGLAKSEYASLAAVVGSQLQSMGASQAESAVKSRELIGVGADLAATFGGSVSDAVGAVGSLLRGERDPIEKYGIAIKAADVKARLAAQGQDKLTGAALKTAEAQATLTLLTEQSKNAHGAFGRESNTLAGQQERLRAQFENVKATVGAGLTPVLTSLLTYVTTKLLPGAQEMAAQLRDKLGPAFAAVGKFVTGTVQPALRGLSGDTDGKVLPAFRAVTAFIGANVLPVLKALGAFIMGTVVPAVVTLATPVIGALRSALSSVGQSISSNREQLATLGNAVLTVAKVIGPLATVVGTVLAASFRVAGGVISTIIGLIGGLVRAVQSALAVIRKLASAAKTVGSVVGNLNPFAAVPLGGFGPPLVGGYATGPALGPLTTAALGDGGLNLLARSPNSAGIVVVDRRSFPTTVNISGAVDPVGTARQLEQVLADQARRMGRAPTLTGAMG